MRLRIGCPRVALIVAPHADDETIGAFGLIRALRRRGAAVRILVVSDGSASHPGSTTWPPARLIRERRRETLRAMRTLGIARPAVTFLGLPDGGLAEQADACRRTLARRLRQTARLDLLVGPVALDDHPDHRAVATALAAARLPRVRWLGYQVWPVERAAARGACLPLDGAAALAKRRAVRGYRTQMGMITDAEAGFGMTQRQFAAFTRPVERYRTEPR